MKEALLAGFLVLYPISDKPQHVRCQEGMCLVPANDLMYLLDANNELQMEVRRLKERCPDRRS